MTLPDPTLYYLELLLLSYLLAFVGNYNIGVMVDFFLADGLPGVTAFIFGAALGSFF